MQAWARLCREHVNCGTISSNFVDGSMTELFRAYGHRIRVDPSRRFDTRANGEKRTFALMEVRRLTPGEAASPADITLATAGALAITRESAPQRSGAQHNAAEAIAPVAERLPVAEAHPDIEILGSTITLAPEIAPLVNAFIEIDLLGGHLIDQAQQAAQAPSISTSRRAMARGRRYIAGCSSRGTSLPTLS
jgi:hypothetical protein